MANKSDLESREADCKSIDDFIALAQQALTDPADKDYAKELLEKAEMQCQMPLDYIKVADVVAGELGEKAWTLKLIDKAAKIGGDHFAHAQMALIVTNNGDAEKANLLYQKAMQTCGTPEQLQQLSKRMKANGTDHSIIRKLYNEARSQQQTPLQRLHWVEGIMPLFKDADWAEQEYDEIAGDFTSAVETARLRASRRSRLRMGLY